MIEIAVILIAVGALIDVCLVALADVKFDRRRVDRRWRRG